MQWIKHTKACVSNEFPSVSIRRLGISFNVEMVRRYGIELGDYAEIFMSDDEMSVGIKFHKNKTPDGYLVTFDGGSSKTVKTRNTLFIACGHFIRSNAAIAALRGEKQKNKMMALQDKESGMIYFNLTPTFQHKASERSPTSNEKGVYRYLMDGEVVYIGQGVLSSRLSDPDRKTWLHDEIEYMLLDDESERFKVESAMIEEHKEANGRLPFYNRIKGRKIG